MTTESRLRRFINAGWTGSFLVPLLQEKKLSYAVTTREGSKDAFKFVFNPESEDPLPFETLPNARSIVIIFPIYLPGGSERLLRLYNATHPDANPVRWMQLGSTGIWDGGRTVDEKKRSAYLDRHSPINPENDRARAENELLGLHSSVNLTTILNLCGLYGGPRSIRRYVGRIAGTKELLAQKSSIHMIHGKPAFHRVIRLIEIAPAGIDVARAILAVHEGKDNLFGQRWLLTDMRVYDWWDLASKWGDAGEEGRGRPMEGPQAQWVTELMQETGIKGLPRSAEEMGKGLTSVDFWQAVKISPIMGGQLD